MDKRRITLIVVGGALALALAIFFVLYFGLDSRDRVQVKLPDTEEGDYAYDGQNDSQSQLVQVDTENVRRVIENISRDEIYTMTMTVESFWSGGKRTVVHDVRRDGNRMLVVSTDESGQIKNTYIDNDSVSVWYEGERTKHEFPLGEFELDDLLGIYTYTQITDESAGDITDAGYTVVGDKNCIYVEISRDDYITRCWVDANSGQLIQMERSFNGTVVVSAIVNSYNAGIEDVSIFDEQY